MTEFTVRQSILSAFVDAWNVIRPTWDHATQTSFPPRSFSEPQTEWVKIVCTNQGGRNRAVGILDEVGSLLTVDCYAPFDENDPTTMFDPVDQLATDAHQALRSMTLPEGVDDVRIEPRDFPLTGTGFQHKRLTLFFRFDLPRIR